jgi:hypothetical protein
MYFGPRFYTQRFIQNVLRSTLLHPYKTTKKCIQFLNKHHFQQYFSYVVAVSFIGSKILIKGSYNKDKGKITKAEYNHSEMLN